MSFAATLRAHGFDTLPRSRVQTLQINVGKVCNQACHHCHVEAGPKRTEAMTAETAERILELLARAASVRTVDITGGAPELNPSFKRLAVVSRRLGKSVIDRCNLTILLEPGFEELPEFLACEQVEIIASLPCYTEANVDAQRGRGVFERSIRALKRLNEIGYGLPDSTLRLNLVYNPGGASLPPPQAALEVDYKRRLREDFGIEFHQLFTITNMPIHRFTDYLVRIGKQEYYGRLLESNFNAATMPNLMCRTLISVSWDGRLYDCDFNQMLEMPTERGLTVWDIDSFEELARGPIRVGEHCFGCTAGAGSSCGGTIA
jgi:radical SAM/Cys-rich protein